MSPQLAAEILEHAYSSDKELYKATLAAVAQARKVRPLFLERHPRAERHVAMLSTLSRPAMEPAAGGLLRGWLLKKHTALLTDFLDALGLPHKEGVVEELPQTMDDAKLRSAVETILAKHPQEVVIVYLHAFYEMNEARWPNLKALLETEPRLQFGS
ncbi:MAG TPA: hypothetical protein VEL06_09745 [Haliangiales bacterium]|nr:hypothetical protein [Haliangiales bacterium]